MFNLYICLLNKYSTFFINNLLLNVVHYVFLYSRSTHSQYICSDRTFSVYTSDSIIVLYWIVLGWAFMLEESGRVSGAYKVVLI